MKESEKTLRNLIMAITALAIFLIWAVYKILVLLLPIIVTGIISLWEKHKKKKYRQKDDAFIANLPDETESYADCSLDPEYVQCTSEYFDGVEKIKENASLLYNLGITSGPRMDTLIKQCFDNVEQFNKCVPLWKKYDQDIPKNVPAYTRLAIIFNRQKEYAKECIVCKYAIDNGLNSPNMNMKIRLMEPMISHC